MIGSDTVVSYVLDADKRLIEVGGAWDNFALENGARELLPPEPLGRPLQSFISDSTTNQLYDSIFEKVKRTGRPVSFPIRCDSPTLRRQLELTVRHERDRFLVRSVLVSATQRAAMPVGSGTPGAAASAFWVSCSWCKRMSDGGTWLEVEEAVAKLRIFDTDRVNDISHGICEDCVQRMESVLNAP